MKILIVINGTSKSWAYGLEIAAREKQNNRDVLIVEVSKLTTIRPLSIARIKYSKLFSRKYELNIFKFRTFSKISFYGFFMATKFLFRFKIKGIFDFPLNEFIDVNGIIRARLSQTLGTPSFTNSDIPLSYLFKHLYRIYCSESISRTIFRENFDRIYVFNGREPIEATWIQIAKNQGLQIKILERASSNQKFEIYDKSPHYHPEWWSKIESYSSQINLKNKEIEIASKIYLQNKVNGFDSFLGQKWDQFYYNHELAPDYKEDSYVVFFSTSSHEYSPIDEFNSKQGYSNQLDAVRDLSEVCKFLKFKLIIRRHPNSISTLDKLDREKEIWAKFTDENTQVIEPREKVNSITLATKARVIFVWRSGIGVETINLGKPTYALGTAKWALDHRVRSWSKNEIRNIISKPERCPPELLSKYLAYMSTGGENLLIFKNVDRWGVTLKDDRIIFNYAFQRAVTKIQQFWRVLVRRKFQRKT